MSIKTVYYFTALTGGAATALDSVDGKSLLDGDVANVPVIAQNCIYIYILDATSEAAESSPGVISPDTNAGTKRWILVGTRTLDGVTITDLGTGFSLSGGTTPKILTVDETVAMSSKAPKASPVFTGLVETNDLIMKSSPWVDVRAFSTFADALTAAANKTMLVASTVTISDNTTIPDDVAVMVVRGGSFSIVFGKTLSINGSFNNPDNGQCFTGFTIGVTFGSNLPKRVDPVWFGLPSSPVTLVWRYTMPGGEPVYSSPIRGTVRDAGGTAYDAIVFQSWDWYLYALKCTDGTLIWRKAFEDTSYGRPQMSDVNGDGYNEIFGSSHDGKIWSLTDQGENRWQHSNLYDREGNGTATGGGAKYLTDTTKNWVSNSFLRAQGPGFNASIEILSGTGAGQIREIESRYSSTRLNIITAWGTIPNATSVYRVNPANESDKYFMHAGQLSQESGVWYLYVTGFDGQAVKLNADTGAIIWRFSTLENIEPYPLIVDINGDDILECLVVSVDGTCYCLNSLTGAVVWSTYVTDEGLDAFLNYGDVDNDAVLEVVVNSRFNRVYILDGVTGVQKYVSIDTGGDLDSRPLLIPLASGMMDIAVSGDSGLVYKFSVVSGSPFLITKWRYFGSPGPNSISEYNSSPFLLSTDFDGREKAVFFDMLGTGIILTLDGTFQDYIFATGGVEGTPIVGDFDGDGKTEMVLTTIDGHVEKYRFR